MGMESDKIKLIVAKAKALTKGQTDEVEAIMKAMVKDMARSPTFAVAIIQHLQEEGVDLMLVETEQAEAFREKFRPQIEKLGERELTQIRKISGKLFSA